MKIVVRFRDGKEAVRFDSEEYRAVPHSAWAEMGQVLSDITHAFAENKITEAWIELGGGKKLHITYRHHITS